MREMFEASAREAGIQAKAEPSMFDELAFVMVKTGGARSLAEADEMQLDDAFMWLHMVREASGRAQ